MSKFKIKVTLTETKTYSYEIDAPKQSKAEDGAYDRAIGDLPRQGMTTDEDGNRTSSSRPAMRGVRE